MYPRKLGKTKMLGEMGKKEIFRMKVKGTGVGNGPRSNSTLFFNTFPIYFYPICWEDRSGRVVKKINNRSSGNREKLVSKWTLISFFLAKNVSHGYQIAECAKTVWQLWLNGKINRFQNMKSNFEFSGRA